MRVCHLVRFLIDSVKPFSLSVSFACRVVLFYDGSVLPCAVFGG